MRCEAGGSMGTTGGLVNSDAIWVTSDTWEAEVSARVQLQHKYVWLGFPKSDTQSTVSAAPLGSAPPR